MESFRPKSFSVIPRIPGKKVLIAAGAVIVSLAALSLVSFDITRYAPDIESTIASSTGAKVKAQGIHLKFLPQPTLTFEGVSAGKGDLVSLSARVVRVKVSVIRYLFGRPAAASVEAVGADISVNGGLIRDAGGKGVLSLPVRSATLIDSKVRLLGRTGIGLPGNFSTVSLSNAYIKEDGAGFIYGAEGAFKDGPAFALSGGFSADMKEATIKGGVKGFDIAPFKPRLTKACECVLPDGSIDAGFSLSYATPAVKLSVERFSFAAQGFSIKGELDFFGSKDLTGRFKGALSSTPMSFKVLKEALPMRVMPDFIAEAIKSLDPLDGAITVVGLSASGSLERSAMGGLSVREGPMAVTSTLDKLRFRYARLLREVSELSGRVTLKEDALTLTGVTGRYGKGYVKAFNGTVTGIKKGGLNYDADMEMLLDAEESLEAARRFSGGAVRRRLENLAASGKVGLTLGVKGSLRRHARPKFSGVASLSGVKFAYALAPLAIQSLSGEIAFDDKKVGMKRLTASDGHSSFELNGTVEGYLADAPSFELAASGIADDETLRRALSSDGPIMDGDIRFNARVKSRKDGFAAYASLDMVKTKDRSIAEKGKGAVKGKRLSSVNGGELFLEETYGASAGAGIFKASGGSIWGHPFKDLSATILLDAEAIRVKPVSATIDNGRAQGQAVFYRKKDNPVLFEVAFDFNGLDIATLIASAGAREKVLAGGVNADAALSARRGASPFSSGLNGSVTVSSERGRLYKFLLFTKIFSIVNIVSIDELFKEGLPYKKLKGTFTIKDGIISTSDMYLDSDSMRMSAAGEIDLTRSGIAAYLALHPFVTLDKIVSNIPVAGWIITGKEKSFVSMYYGITGPLKKPDVSPAPVKNISEGVLGILERLVETPAGDAPAQGR